jgi:hypothetical protein
MSAIEQFGQQQREMEWKDRETNEPQGPGLDEILAHPKDNALFSKYLENGNDEDQILAAKLLAGELGAEDFHVLSEKRKSFLEVKERAKGVSERLEKNMDGIIAASPQMKEVAQVAGMDAVRKAVIKRMDEIAITDPEGFADLESRFLGLTEAEASIGRGNERIAAIAKEQGFTEQEYSQALMAREAGDPYALEDLIKSKMGVFKKTFTSYEELMRQGGEIDSREDIKDRLSLINWNLNNIGGALSAKLFEDKTAKEILVANFKRERGTQQPDASFSQINELAKRPRDLAAAQREWEKYKEAHESDPGYDIDVAKSQFGTEYAERALGKKRTGFWATIFRLMLSKGVESKLK